MVRRWIQRLLLLSWRRRRSSSSSSGSGIAISLLHRLGHQDFLLDRLALRGGEDALDLADLLGEVLLLVRSRARVSEQGCMV